MLNNQQLESFLYEPENPSNILVDSQVPREILRFLLKEEYITKFNIVRDAD